MPIKMPKKKKKYEKKGFYPSGLKRPESPYFPEASPKERMSRGDSAVISWEELKEKRGSRVEPRMRRELAGIIENGPWAALDDAFMSAGFGFTQDLTLDHVDEIAGILLALTPGKKQIGTKHYGHQEVSPLEYEKTRDAIRKVHLLYKHEYPGWEALGRGLSIAFQISGMPGLVKIAAPMIVRYGFKPTMTLIKKLGPVVKNNPQFAKLAKTKPFEFLSNAAKLLKADKLPAAGKLLAGSKAAKAAGEIGVESALQSMGESLKPPMEAARDAAQDPFVFVPTALPIAGAGIIRAGKKGAELTAKGLKKLDDSNWLPRMKEKFARFRAANLGFSPKAIDFLEKSKYLFDETSSRDETLGTIQHLLETIYQSSDDLSRIGMSKLSRTEDINVSEVRDEIDKAIEQLFKKRGYKPSAGDDPLILGGEFDRNPFSVSDEEFEQLRIDLGTKGGPEKAVQDAIDVADRKKETVRYQDKKGPLKERYQQEDDPIEIGTSTQEVVPGTGKTASERKKGLSRAEILEQNSIIRRNKKNKALNQLLEMRESLEAYRNGRISQTQLKELQLEAEDLADIKRLDESERKGELSQFKGAFGTLSHRLNKILKGKNKEYAKVVGENAKIKTLLKKQVAGESFEERFGVNIDIETNSEGIREYKITFPDKDRTYTSFQEAVTSDKQKDNPYRDQFKDLINKGMEGIEKNKELAKRNRKTVTTRQGAATPFLRGEGSDDLFEKTQKDIIEDAFESPERANEIINALEQHYYKDPRLVNQGKDAGQEAFKYIKRIFTTPFSGPRKTGLALLGGGVALSASEDIDLFGAGLGVPMLALFMLKHGDPGKARDFKKMISEAKKWRSNFEKHPRKFLKKLDVAEEFIDKWVPHKYTPGSKAARAVKKTYESYQPASSEEIQFMEGVPLHGGEGGLPKANPGASIEIEPEFPEADQGRTPAQQNLGLDAFSKAEAAPVPENQDHFEDFEEFESFKNDEIVDPEIEDREKRKDRINAFLKQQGAYKRRKRKGYA